jgi:O-antigen/teichoic acid export membrane protein
MRVRHRILAGNPISAVQFLQRFGEAGYAIVASTSAQVGTIAVTSALGFVYWWVAARRFPPHAVGVAAASVSGMTLLATVGALGLGTLLMGELPRQRGQARPLIMAALLLAADAGGALGILFALVAPHFSPDLQPLAASIGRVVLFALGVSLTAGTLVLDQALIGLLRGRLQFGRNTLFAAAKLAVLVLVGFLPVGRTGVTIYATWVAGTVISLAGLAWVVLRQGGREHSYRPQWRLLRSFGRAALGHHALNLALQVPSLTLPVVVTTLLSATANAYFYATWMLAGLAFAVPFALSISLYAVGAAAPTTLAHKMRLTLGLAVATGVLANGVLLVGASPLLHLFGPAYAVQAAWSLRILGLGVFPLIVKDHYVAIRRIHGRVVGAALGLMGGSILEVGLAGLGARAGSLSGLSLGWLVAVCLEAILMAPTVYRAAAQVPAVGQPAWIWRRETAERQGIQ